MTMLYKLMSACSVIIRLFYLPNPFQATQFPEMDNYLLEPVLHVLTFNVVGLFYRKRSAPALGSLLYLVFYIIHSGAIYILLKLDVSTTVMWIVAIVYMVILCMAVSVKRWFNRMLK